MRANAGWKRWVAWEAVQIVARSDRSSATPHEGPSEPWVWIGQRYVALSVRTPGPPAVRLERAPRLATVSSRTTGVARTASKRVAWSGRPEPDDHSVLRSRAARTAFHSRSATTPRKLAIRTTRAPGTDAIDDSSTETSVAPTAGGRMTRPCSRPGSVRAWTEKW